MAEVTRKRNGELLRVVFKILLEHPDGLQARTVLQEMKKRVTLTQYEAGEYESGGGQRVDPQQLGHGPCLGHGAVGRVRRVAVEDLGDGAEAGVTREVAE